METLPRADRSVFETRLSALKERAEQSGCSGLVLVDALTQYWASGYNVNRDASSWERPCALVIPLDGEPAFVLNEICEPHAKLTVRLGWCWVDDMRYYAEHPRVTDRIPSIHEWGALLRDTLRSRGIDGARLACDNPGFCRYWMGIEAGSVELVDASAWVRQARMVKDEIEVATLRAASEITDEAMGAFHELVREGERVGEVAAEIQRRLSTIAIRRFPDDRVEARVAVSTGVDTACVNGPYAFTGRQFQAGDSLITIVILTLNGYSSENERTFVVKHCPEEKRRYFQTAIDAQAAGRAVAVAGNRICDIDAASQQVIEAAGLSQYVHHRTGHGIGLSGHEPPGDMAYNYNALEPNMLFTVEPGIYVPEVGGFRHSDTILIGSEPESLTKYPRSIEECTIAG